MPTFTDLTNQAQVLLEEAKGVSGHWTVAEVQNAVNDGLEELSDATEFYERNTTLTLKPNGHYYDMRSLAYPYTMLRITSIWNPTRNQWLDPFTIPDLDYRTARQWELVIGDVRYWFVRGLWWLGFFPMPSSEGSILKILYKALHPRMIDPLETPQNLPDDLHRAAVNYAVYDLLSKDGETQKALAYWQRYKELEDFLSKQTGMRVARDRVGRMGIF